MIIKINLDKLVSEKITALYKERDKKRTPSGRLSASILGWPLQWQVLKYLKVPQQEKDQYTLRRFLRGEHVEEFVAGMMDDIKQQVEVYYREAIGYVDVLTDNMPYEIKSVANSKYKWILRQAGADPQHKLQGAFYALGLGMSEYSIVYVASDDYRITTFTYLTLDSKDEIDRIIDEYNGAIKNKVVPPFRARYKWQEKFQYNSYPEFMNAGTERIQQLLEHYKVKWPK